MRKGILKNSLLKYSKWLLIIYVKKRESITGHTSVLLPYILYIYIIDYIINKALRMSQYSYYEGMFKRSLRRTFFECKSSLTKKKEEERMKWEKRKEKSMNDEEDER